MSSSFLVECSLHWSCKTDKGYQRIAMSCDLEMPFVPFVGMVIQLHDEMPSTEIEEVAWCTKRRSFYVMAACDLNGWSSKLFESLLNEIKAVDQRYDPELYDDNWIYKRNAKGD